MDNMLETEEICNTIDELKYLLLFARLEQQESIKETIKHYEQKLNSLYI